MTDMEDFGGGSLRAYPKTPPSPPREVWVVTAYYVDMSGARVLGVYESEEAAREIVKACNATSQGCMKVVALCMALNRIEDRDVRGDEPEAIITDIPKRKGQHP